MKTNHHSKEFKRGFANGQKKPRKRKPNPHGVGTEKWENFEAGMIHAQDVFSNENGDSSPKPEKEITS